MLRIIVFALVLNVQIRLKAEILTITKNIVVQDPVGCLEDQIWCSIYNTSRKGQLTDVAFAEVNLSNKGSVVIIPSNSDEVKKKIRAMAGLVHVKAKQTLIVEIYNASLTLGAGDEVFIHIPSVRKSKVIVRAVRGDIEVNARGHKVEVTLYEGFQNWFGGMTENGLILTGFPRPIDLKPHLRDWSKTYSLDHWEFRQSAKKFANRWKKAVELGSELNRQFVVRSLASLRKRRKIERIRKRKESDVDAQMRRLFRKRNGL